MSNDGLPPQDPSGQPAADDPRTQIRPAGSPTAPQYGNPDYPAPQQPTAFGQQQPAYGQRQQPQQPPAGQYAAPQYAPQYAPQPGYPAYGQPPQPAGGYAGWGNRVVATLWDMLYIWPAFVGYLVGAILLGVGAGMSSGSGDVSGGGVVLIILGGLVMLAAVAIGLWRYIRNYIIDQGRTGYTYGKRKVGIRLVVEATGQAPGAGSCVGRYFLHAIINNLLYIDYLWPLWDEKKQTLSDKILSTIVVKWPDTPR